MKAFIQRIFLKERLRNQFIHIKSNPFFTNNQPIKTNLSNNIINNSKKPFSRNSTQWLNRHTNDIYVKKSVEVITF